MRNKIKNVCNIYIGAQNTYNIHNLLLVHSFIKPFISFILPFDTKQTLHRVYIFSVVIFKNKTIVIKIQIKINIL